MSRCWASALGGCGGGISGEHIVSRALFPNGATVRGFDWCKMDPKKVGPEALVANCLCKEHNSALSPLDQAAADLRYSMMAIATQSNAATPYKRQRRPAREFRIDGTSFERWCFKAACNMYSCGAFLGLTEWTPPVEVVRFVFGQGSLPEGCGMGVLFHAGLWVENADRLQFSPLGKDKELIGAVLSLRGWHYVCSWGHPVEKLLVAPEDQKTRTPTQAMYHPNRVDYPKGLSFAFDWTGRYDNSSNPYVVEARKTFASPRKKKRGRNAGR